MIKKIITASCAVLTIFWTVGLVAFVPSAQAINLTPGELIKASLPAVYYYGADSRRYVFPNEKTYKTWYADFSGVKIITDAELAAIPIAGNVTYRPGVKLVKITTDPKVYAVAANGILKWVTSESLAVFLYGANWRNMTEDIPDPFFVNYTVGSPINNTSDYSPSTATASSVSINSDKSLIVPTANPILSVSLSPGTPASGNMPGGTTANFTQIILSASAAPVGIQSIKLTRYGLSSNNDVTNIRLVTASGETVGNIANLNTSSQALITFNPALAINANSQLSLYIKASLTQTIPTGNTISLGIATAGDVVLVSGAVLGNFPVIGSYMSISSVANLTDLFLPEGILIGGRQKQTVASFKLTAGSAEDMELNSVTVTDTGTGKVASNFYLYSEKRNDGGSINDPIAVAIMNPVTKTAKFILPLNTVIVSASQSIILTLKVDAVLVDGVTVQNGDSLHAIIANATDVLATGKASGAQQNGSAVTTAATYYVLASYPYIGLDVSSPSTKLFSGAKTLLAIYKITADPAGDVGFLSSANNGTGLANKLTVNIAHDCTAGIGSGFVLADEAGNVLDSQAVDICANNSVTFTFGNPNDLEIAAGTSKKLYIYANTMGALQSGDSVQLYLDDANVANLDFALNGFGNYKFAQYVFKGGIYANVLVR